MTATSQNPLASYLLEAQKIVVNAMWPTADKAAALEHLAELLCKPAANQALIDAGAVTALQLARDEQPVSA